MFQLLCKVDSWNNQTELAEIKSQTMQPVCAPGVSSSSSCITCIIKVQLVCISEIPCITIEIQRNCFKLTSIVSSNTKCYVYPNCPPHLDAGGNAVFVSQTLSKSEHVSIKILGQPK